MFWIFGFTIGKQFWDNSWRRRGVCTLITPFNTASINPMTQDSTSSLAAFHGLTLQRILRVISQKGRNRIPTTNSRNPLIWSPMVWIHGSDTGSSCKRRINVLLSSRTFRINHPIQMHLHRLYPRGRRKRHRLNTLIATMRRRLTVMGRIVFPIRRYLPLHQLILGPKRKSVTISNRFRSVPAVQPAIERAAEHSSLRSPTTRTTRTCFCFLRPPTWVPRDCYSH